jgi:hypothetical protein
MRRLKDYLSFVAWQSGLSYIALWAVTFWSLDWGPIVFGRTDACHVDNAKVMFYWVCDPASPLAILAAVADTALTVTVWAPVYVAAATVQPEAIAIAVPIVAAHVIGLPMAILVMTRLMLRFFAGLRRAAWCFTGRAAAVSAGAIDADAHASAQLAPRHSPPRVPARKSFGLRGT